MLSFLVEMSLACVNAGATVMSATVEMASQVFDIGLPPRLRCSRLGHVERSHDLTRRRFPLSMRSPGAVEGEWLHHGLRCPTAGVRRTKVAWYESANARCPVDGDRPHADDDTAPDLRSGDGGAMTPDVHYAKGPDGQVAY